MAKSRLRDVWDRMTSLASMRLGMVLLLMFGWFCVMSMRVNLGMAMVCMVNASAFAPQLSPHHFNKSQPEFEIQKEEPACIREQNDEFSVENVGYHGDLLWSPSMQSTLFSANFYGSVLTMVPAGYLADRFGSKTMLLVATFDSIIVTLLTPLLVDAHYYAYLVARIVMGLGEGFVPPAMSAVAAHWIPASERSAMAALYTSGNQLAGCAGLLISSRLCSATAIGGWRSIFYIFGSVGVIWGICWWFFMSDSPSNNRWISEKEARYLQMNIKTVNKRKQLSPGRVPWMKILFAPCMLATYLGQFAFNFQVTMMQSYLPTYFRDVVLLDIKNNGLFTAMPFLMTLIFKNIAGLLSDKIRRAKLLSNTNTCIAFQCVASFGSAIALTALATLVDCHTPVLALIILAFTGFCLSTAVVGYFTSQLSVAPCYTGTIVSIGMLMGAFASIASPNMIGKLILSHGTPQEWSVVFYICAGLQVVSGVIFVIYGSADEQPWASEVSDLASRNGSVNPGCAPAFDIPSNGDKTLVTNERSPSVFSMH